MAPETAVVTVRLTEVEPLKRALARIIELHHPVDEEAEFWFDEKPSEHCTSACTSDRTCEGHFATIQVCRECGYEHDGDGPTFRSWPCPTMQALAELIA